MKQFDINLNLDFGNVKLDKLYEDTQKNGNLNVKTTSSEVSRSYKAGETSKYGGNSGSMTETMDLSASVDDSTKTSSNIGVNEDNILNSDNQNVSKVENNRGKTIQNDNINTNKNSGELSNSSNIGTSKSASNNLNNSSQNSNSGLGSNNLASSSDSKMNMNSDELDVRNKRNKPSVGGSSTSSTGGTSTGVNASSMQNSSQSGSTGNLDDSFDMGESLESNAESDGSTVGDTITLTNIDFHGKEVPVEINVDEYTNFLKSFGITEKDINRVLNSEITIENLIEEILSDKDNTRREEMFYASNIQAYGILSAEIQNLEDLRNQADIVDSHEIDAVANFLYRLQNGENLESILTSQVVAWEYTDENGNRNYRYDDPYAAGYMEDITYTPYTFAEMYKDSAIVKDLESHLTEQTYKPLFSKEEKTVHIWEGTPEQQAYFDELLGQYGNTVDKRNENADKKNKEINDLENKVSIYKNIYNAIMEEENYYCSNIEPYVQKEDFYENSMFNENALNTIDKLRKANEDIYVAPDSQTIPSIYITDKEDLVNILSCIINGEGNVSNGYLKAGQNYFHLSSADNILGDYLKYLPCIDEDQKAVFNYIYNTEGIDKAYDFLNGMVYDRLDTDWASETSLAYQNFAKEHPVVSSIGSVVVTPFEGISAFCYSMNALVTKQKIRKTGTLSGGDIARSAIAQDIAKNSEVLSFIYSTGMSMADSLVLIGISAATGGIAAGGAAAAGGAGAAAMASSTTALRLGTGLISAVTMGSRAYVSTLNEALDRGLSDGEAVLLSTVSAVVETAMESMSVSHLLNLEGKLGAGVDNFTAKIADSVKNEKLANILTKGFRACAGAMSQALVEGDEEFWTEVLNYVADIFIAKDLSNYTKTLNYYMNEKGYDEDAALLQTSKDFFGQAFQAFLGGFVSGVCFGAFSETKTIRRASYAIANDMYGEFNGLTKAQKFAQVLEINKNELQEFNEVVAKKQRGEILTEAEEHFFRHGTIEMQIAENMKDTRAAKIRGLIKSIREITQTKGNNTGVVLDVNEIDNFNAAAKDFAEGNKALENLLLTSHKYNVDTLACCGGHIGYTKLDPNTKYNQPYIAFKMTEQFEKCLPTIMEAMGNDNYDIVFIKGTANFGNSFVMFRQNNYSDEMFNTLNRVIENVMSNETIITNVSENTSKMMEIYDYLKNNELSTPVQVEVSKNISGLNSEINYEMYYGSNCDKGSFDAENFVEGIAKVEDTIKSIEVKESVEQLEAKVEDPNYSKGGIFSKEFDESKTYNAYKVGNIYKSTFNDLLEVLNEIKTKNASERFLVEVPNTIGLTSEIIEAIPKNVDVRIIGSLTTEYAKASKNPVMDHFREKATYSKEELQLILNKFNEIEKNINPNWNAYKKALYLYEYMVNNMVYRRPENLDVFGNINRTRTWDTLTGLIHQVSTCSGFAHIYQELCTRQGIDCVKVGGKYLDGKEGDHAWNLVNIEGNTFLVDTIWDAQEREKGNYLVSDFGTSDLNLYSPKCYLKAHKNLTTIDSKWIEATLKDFEGLIPRITNEAEIVEKWQKTIEEDRKRMEYLNNPLEVNNDAVNSSRLTISQFQERISELKTIYSEYSQIHHGETDFKSRTKQWYDKYCEAQSQLLSYDLSDIPFEAWNGVTLVGDENHPLDLSQTHANLDFNLINLFILHLTKKNFQSCKIRNFENIDNMIFPQLDGNTFDREVMEQNPKYFLLGNFSKEFLDRFYSLTYGGISRHGFTIEDFANLSSEQINELQEKANFGRIMHPDDEKIIKIFGLQKCLELCQYSEDLYYDIKNIISSRGISFSVWDSRDLIDLDSYANMVENCTTTQEIKQVTYDFLRKYIIENSSLIRKEDYSKEFVEYNSDLFLVDADIPADVKKNYFSKKLQMDDVVRYWDAFKTIPIEFFVKSPVLSKWGKALGYGKLGELLFENRDIIEDISSLGFKHESDESMFLDYINNYDVEYVCDVNGTIEIEYEDWYEPQSIVKIAKELYGNQEAIKFLIKYKRYIEEFLDKRSIHLNSDFDILDFIQALEPAIFEAIGDGKRYGPDMALYLKDIHPDIYLDESVNLDIREKFYNKEFTSKDFESNPELLQIFGNTNVAYGFSPESTWIASLFGDVENPVEANSYRLRVLKAYESIKDSELKQIFNDFFRENASSIPLERIEYIAPLLNKVSYSNSSELRRLKSEVVSQILLSDNPIKTYEKIERIFVKSNLPTIGKIYLCFKTLYENYKGLDFRELSSISPVLKSKSLRGKDTTIFADLIKANFGSNNRTVREYLTNIEVAYDLYSKIKDGEITFESLDRESRNELTTFRNHLQTLYEQTLSGRVGKEGFNSTDNVVEDIDALSTLLAPNGNTEYYLPDRVVSMFAHFAGFDTLEEVKNYMDNRVAEAEARNIKRAESDLVLEVGDYVKGVDPQYLANILQRGSVAKEYLGASAASDATPLDTDLSRITTLSSNMYETINRTAANSYGSIKLILKNDNRFSVTRTKDGGESIDTYDGTKLETFYSGVVDTDNSEHYGIRTGFASTDIDYIMTDVADPSIGFEIARNGFYIPVVDRSGKVIFTPDDYKELRLKMQGLSYYDTADYILSDSLINKDVMDMSKQIEQSKKEVTDKIYKINQVLGKALSDNGLTLKTTIDGDLSEGSVELLDTGSTGRFTNKPGDGDFDFMMRVDRSVFFDSERMDKLKQSILQSLGIENNEGVIASGDFRLKDVKIDDITVDIDITFVPKSDKLSYSTDASLQDRLNNILEQHPEQYKYVISNILLAKQVLKDGGVYKPNRGETPQGGLGGVGVENWILQHGGSFVEAAESFVEAAKGKTFEEFKEVYQIWDFGENHMAEKKGINPHDEFISNNMSAEGYAKMVKVLREYLDGYYASNQSSYENRLVNAINSGEGIIDIIKEINTYMNDNFPEGYSNIVEFKESIADTLIKTGTLDKLTNQQFYELIKSNIILRKVLDSERLTNFVCETLDVSPRKTMQLFSDLTSDELVQIFDKEQIRDYFNGLNDNSFIKICETIIKNKKEDILVKSTNLIDRLFNVDSVKLSEIISKMDLAKILINDVPNGVVFLDKIMEVYNNEETIFKSPSLAFVLKISIPYINEYKSYLKEMEKLDDLIKQTARNKLVENSMVPIASDAVIKGDMLSCYDVKYLVDGVEYTREISTDSLGEFDLTNWHEQFSNILEDKLKITSITKNNAKSVLRNIMAEEDGLNVVTLEIDGKVEKHLASFLNGRTSLLNLANNREINEVKILSVDPYIKSTYDFKTNDKGTAYKISYKIDDKSYEVYLPVVSNEVKIDEFFVKNNLYNATDINIESFKVSDISPENISYKRYANSSEIFSDSYFGGDQSDVRKIVVAALDNETLSDVNRQKSEVLIGLIKEYYPDASASDIKNIAKAYESNGCFYMATANAFITYMNSIPNGAKIFKDRMGFDLAITDGSSKSFNLEAVALEYYLYTHKNFKNCDSVETLLDNTAGLNLETHEKAAPSYFGSKGIDIELLSIHPHDLSYKQQLLVQSLNMDAIWVVTDEGFDLEGFKNVDIDGEDGSVVDAEVNGNVIKNVGAHAMLITDIDSDGNVIVSSWSGKYKFLPKSTASVAINGMKFNVSDIKTDVIENELVNAINSNMGVDDEIARINSYTSDNLPEGYSSLSEFKEKLADTLIASDTLSKLSNKQFYDLIRDKVFLKKVLGSEKLNTLIKDNLDVAPRVILSVIDGLSSDEIVKVFDNDIIKNYVDNLTDEQYLNFVKVVFEEESNILIASSVLTDRLLQVDVKSFIELLKGDRGSIPDTLGKDPKNSVIFIDKLIKVFGTEELVMKYPLLPRAIAARIPFDETGIYLSYNNKLEELQLFADNYLASKLKENADINIPSNGIIDKEGYFIIKYSIDGKEYEYRNTVGASSSGLNLVDNFKDDYWEDILDGKFKIISITEDTIRNNLYIENVEQEGLNVVTIEIDGKIEKHILSIYNNSDALIKKYKNKDIKDAKIISIEPFITSSYNFEAKNASDTYLMRYKIDGKEYSHYLLPDGWANTVYVNSFITGNNLYNIRDIVIEPTSLSVSDIKSQIDIKNYNNSSEVFSDEVYGGRQGSIREIVTKALNGENLTEIEKQKSELLIELIKKYYPDASDTDIKNIANYCATNGCGYMAVANAFVTYMNSLNNGAEIFKDKMGFDLAILDGNSKSFNLEAIALDYYLYTNKVSRGYDTIRDLFINLTAMDATYKYAVEYYFKSKGIDVVANGYGTDYEQYKQKFLAEVMNNSNAFIMLGSNGFSLERLDSSITDTSDGALANAETKGAIETNIGGHDMLITDIDENGNLIVSSWSGKYRFIPDANTKNIEFSTIEFKIEDTIDRIKTARNRVFDTGLMGLGRNNPIALHTSSDSIYRVAGISQINDIIDCGYVRPKQGKVMGGHSNEVFWSLGGDSVFYYDKRPVIEVSTNKLKDNQIGAVSLDDLQAIWMFDNEQNKYVNKLDYIKELYNLKHNS